MKIVHFDKYCKTCKYRENSEKEKPCDECLAVPAREHSHKPIRHTTNNSKFA